MTSSGPISKTELLLREVDLIARIMERLSNHGHSTKRLAITAWMTATGFGFQQSIPNLHLVGFVAAMVFWQLDAFFLSKERILGERHVLIARALSLNMNEPDIADPLSLATGVPGGAKQLIFRLLRSLFARSIWPIYLTLAAISALAWKTERFV